MKVKNVYVKISIDNIDEAKEKAAEEDIKKCCALAQVNQNSA